MSAPATHAKRPDRIRVDSECVVVGGERLLRRRLGRSAGSFRLGGTELVTAIMPMPLPEFAPDAPEHAHDVHLEVGAFSCNYRDRAILLAARGPAPPQTVTTTGSEFCGRVLAVGSAVTDLRVGDRVRGANDWPRAPGGSRSGVPTNHASRRRLILDEGFLVRVPDAMCDEEAAAFSIGAQTAYAMVRRLGLTTGASVLVTAAASSTSQFAISALRSGRTELRIVALTRSKAGARAARERGADTVVQLAVDDQGLANVAGEVGGFDAIIDPYYDVYFASTSRHLRDGGRYISCGLAAQYDGASFPDELSSDTAMARSLLRLFSRNAAFLGHCLGTRDDLDRALADYQTGRWCVPLDSVHTGPPAPFFDRSWNEPDRVGKVVYRFEAD